MKAFDATRFYFDRAADQMDLSENMRRLMIIPKRLLDRPVKDFVDKKLLKVAAASN